MSLKHKTIGFIGAGHMGEALIRGLLAAGALPARQLIATDVRPARLEELQRAFGILTTNGLPAADIFVLAVKPQQMAEVLGQLAPRVTAATVVISIAAGVTTARIAAGLGGQPRVVRVMPNTPALVGQGAAAVCPGAFATAEDVAVAVAILGAVGKVVRVEERLMDAVTAVSGSGPAYVFFLAEALIAAGERLGLEATVARQLAVQTIVGAGKLLAESGELPAVLRQQVTSPGGTTEAALKVLTDRGLDTIVIEAVRAAEQRGRELAGG